MVKWPSFCTWHFEIHFLECKQAYSFSLKFHWDLLPRVHLTMTMSQHGFREWPGTEPVTSHYLNQKWSGLVTYTCVAWPMWVNQNVPLTEGISWWLTKTINCLNASASRQGNTSCMIHGYWSLHHTHRPLLNATERYFVWLLTQASWSLASCG